MCSLVEVVLLTSSDVADPAVAVGLSLWLKVSSVTWNVMACPTPVNRHSITANTPIPAIGLLMLLMHSLRFSPTPLVRDASLDGRPCGHHSLSSSVLSPCLRAALLGHS